MHCGAAKKSLLFQKNLFARTDRWVTKMPSTPDITYTYFHSPSRSFWQLARESPGSVFISMNAVWKGSKFQKSPPVSAWFMSSTFSQSLTKNFSLHFSIFPKFFHHWTFSSSNAECENCANLREAFYFCLMLPLLLGNTQVLKMQHLKTYKIHKMPLAKRHAQRSACDRIFVQNIVALAASLHRFTCGSMSEFFANKTLKRQELGKYYLA